MIDAYHEERDSVMRLHKLDVTHHARCVVRVAVLNETHSPDGGHKFKILQLIASAYIGG